MDTRDPCILFFISIVGLPLLFAGGIACGVIAAFSLMSWLVLHNVVLGVLGVPPHLFEPVGAVMFILELILLVLYVVTRKQSK